MSSNIENLFPNLEFAKLTSITDLNKMAFWAIYMGTKTDSSQAKEVDFDKLLSNFQSDYPNEIIDYNNGIWQDRWGAFLEATYSTELDSFFKNSSLESVINLFFIKQGNQAIIDQLLVLDNYTEISQKTSILVSTILDLYSKRIDISQENAYMEQNGIYIQKFSAINSTTSDSVFAKFFTDENNLLDQLISIKNELDVLENINGSKNLATNIQAIIDQISCLKPRIESFNPTSLSSSYAPKGVELFKKIFSLSWFNNLNLEQEGTPLYAALKYIQLENLTDGTEYDSSPIDTSAYDGVKLLYTNMNELKNIMLGRSLTEIFTDDQLYADSNLRISKIFDDNNSTWSLLSSEQQSTVLTSLLESRKLILETGTFSGHHLGTEHSNISYYEGLNVLLDNLNDTETIPFRDSNIFNDRPLTSNDGALGSQRYNYPKEEKLLTLMTKLLNGDPITRADNISFDGWVKIDGVNLDYLFIVKNLLHSSYNLDLSDPNSIVNIALKYIQIENLAEDTSVDAKRIGFDTEIYGFLQSRATKTSRNYRSLKTMFQAMQDVIYKLTGNNLSNPSGDTINLQSMFNLDDPDNMQVSSAWDSITQDQINSVVTHMYDTRRKIIDTEKISFNMNGNKYTEAHYYDALVLQLINNPEKISGNGVSKAGESSVLINALNSSQTFNEINKTQLRQAFWIMESFYKSATTIVTRLRSTIQKINRNIR